MKTTISIFNSYESKQIFDIGTMFFFKNFLYLEVNEGTHLGLNQFEKMQSLANYYYKGEDYALICNKNISYSVNPIAYSCINQSEKVRCIAMFKDNTNGFDLSVEAYFIKKPFNIFQTFDEAVDWINSNF